MLIKNYNYILIISFYMEFLINVIKNNNPLETYLFIRIIKICIIKYKIKINFK